MRALTLAWILLAAAAGAAVGYDQGVRTGHREAIEAVRETLETIEADIGRAWRTLDSMYVPPHLVMEADGGDR